MNSPLYRDRYSEFLKSAYPKIPFPESSYKFKKIANYGNLLRITHSLEGQQSVSNLATFPMNGSSIIQRKLTKKSPGYEMTNDETKTGRVWINDDQYFDNVPELAWNFYIGGYQPAQKWLKDRKDRTLSYDDIEHYQKIIAALVETDKIMDEIDEVGVV